MAKLPLEALKGGGRRVGAGAAPAAARRRPPALGGRGCGGTIRLA